MVRRETIAPSIYLRTLNDHLGVPIGTLARVETVGNCWTGEFMFTVRWLGLGAGVRHRPLSNRTLNLWESDLISFEIVMKEEAAALLASSLSHEGHPHLRLSNGYCWLGKGRKDHLDSFSDAPSDDFSQTLWS